jgi:WASH complex subunit strumpellin
MRPLPLRLEAKDLKEYAQLDQRYEMASLTHQVSVFTEGVLVMEKTLLGVIQVCTPFVCKRMHTQICNRWTLEGS